MKRSTGQDRTVTRHWRPATQAVRGGTARSEWGETSEAIFLTSGYAYDSAGEAAARFAGTAQGMTYSRLQNPTVQMFEERLCLLDGAEAARATCTGMAAMSASLMSHLSAGDHLVAGQALFGSCRVLVDTILPRFGIETTTVDGRDTDAWARARRPNTKAFFLETPANPTLDICDIAAISDIGHDAGALVVVDNAFASPILQQPLALGADVVCYSATKHIDGQGRVLAGAVLGSEKWINDTYLAYARHTGPVLSAFNAWLLLKSLETLDLRVQRMVENAAKVAAFLEPRVPRALYPGLASHPQHELAMRQQSGKGGAVVSFDVQGDDPETARANAFHVIDSTRVVSIATNLGDTKTIVTHPGTTSHGRLTEAQRQAAGIGQGLIRCAVGLEHAGDIQDDLLRGLSTLRA